MLGSSPASPPERVLALDLGGTKTAAAIVGGDGSLLCRESAATPLGDASLALAAMVALGKKVLAKAGPATALGLALPGIVDPGSGMLRSSPSSGWENVPFAAMLSEAFSLPVTADNDARACAWAEALFGAGRGLDSFFWMTVSTGVGGAFVAGGRVLAGAGAMAGEIGHVVVNPGGEHCGCGNRGCLEAEASGTAWRRKALRLLDSGGASTIAAIAREDIDAAVVAREARGGDGLCAAVVHEAGLMLARGIAAVVNILDPRAIIMGGGVAGSLDLLLPIIRAELPSLTLAGRTRRIEMRASGLGYDAALFGAAALALHPY